MCVVSKCSFTLEWQLQNEVSSLSLTHTDTRTSTRDDRGTVSALCPEGGAHTAIELRCAIVLGLTENKLNRLLQACWVETSHWEGLLALTGLTGVTSNRRYHITSNAGQRKT